ncbi:unnamed protein product [Malus baccata var. baccata]
MKVEQVLHMKGGVGKTSYATNSLLSTSSNPPPSLQAFLNHLPGNDFNTVFRSLPGFYKKLKEEGKLGPCFITATPGSFYGRLFPNNSLHFVHSSYALIWISEAPKGFITEAGEGLNKKNISIAKTSSSAVCAEYLEQFKKDFRVFLRSRIEELVPGGSMGLIEEEKLDTFNTPYYAPTTKEVEDVIEAEGSFTFQSLEVFRNEWDSYLHKPILASQFGEANMDDLFRRFEEDVLDHMEKENCQFINDLVDKEGGLIKA